MDAVLKIRRNRTITFHCDNDLSPEVVERLFGEKQEITDKISTMLDESRLAQEGFERQIWDYVSRNHLKDLDGVVIRPETHEITYDMEREERNGCLWMVAKNVYIQPKKSMYDNNLKRLKL